MAKFRNMLLNTTSERSVSNAIDALFLHERPSRMPLKEGSSQETISENIRRELHHHPEMDPKQAAAIAYSKARGDDCDYGAKMDAVADRLIELNSRMDSYEAKRK